MVEIRVEVADVTCTDRLMRRLMGLFDHASVTFDEARNVVRVCSEWESRSVSPVIDTVESWLAADGVSSAELSVGDHSYTMFRPTVVVTPSGEGGQL